METITKKCEECDKIISGYGIAHFENNKEAHIQNEHTKINIQPIVDITENTIVENFTPKKSGIKTFVEKVTKSKAKPKKK